MLKKHRKNTFFMALIVGISAISLATLGYSVWIAGIQNKEASTNTSVTMDFATNNTVIASVTSSKSSITIDSGEVVSSENNPLGRPSSSVKSERDLSYPIQMELITSNNATIDGVSAAMAVKTNSETRPDLNIVPTFKDTGNSETDKTLIGYTPVKVNGSDKKDIFGRDLTNDGVFATNYTFLDLTSTSISSGFVKDSTYSLSGYSRYTYTDNNFGFTFGTFFGGKDPEGFYNLYILQYRNAYLTNPTPENKSTYLKSIQAATDELNLMYRLMNGSTINVTFTANVTFNNQQP